MLINVPQYIDVEDKIVGPLTAKQLGWLIVMGITLLILWNVLPRIAFFMIGIPLGLMFLSFAFYKPYGQPLGNFVISGFFYFFRPKIYIWKRSPEPMRIPQVAKNQQIPTTSIHEKRMTSTQMRGLAHLLDSEGVQKDENIVQLLKDTKIKK